MKPEERDRIRAHAARGLRVCSGSECSVECRMLHAILAYVPPGNATLPAGMTLDANDRGVSVSGGPDQEAHGWLYLSSLADAESLALLLLAAVHAARTATTTTTPATSAAEGPTYDDRP